MASANLELVRSILAAWERGDYSSTDWQHPEIEFVIADGPTPASGTGAAGIKEVWGAFLGAWEGFHHRADDYRDLDGERVLVLAHYSGRGKTSGLEVGQTRARGANIFHMRDGRVTKIVYYLDREHALADIGLAPRTSAPGG